MGLELGQIDDHISGQCDLFQFQGIVYRAFGGFGLGCLKVRILGIFISPILGTIDHAGIYFLAKSYF